MSEYPFDKRFRTPVEGAQIENPYDIDSSLLQDVISRGLEPVAVYQNINLSTAGTLAVEAPGTAIVIYGHDNSSNKAVNTTAYVEVFFEKKPVQTGLGFPMKHARGYRGPFSRCTLSWPAQNGVYCDIVVHRFNGQPWIDGEAAT